MKLTIYSSHFSLLTFYKEGDSKMCLAIPGKVLEINGDKGLIDISGMKVETFLNLLEDVKIGDYILIHAGFAIERLPEEEAMERFKLFKEMEILG